MKALKPKLPTQGKIIQGSRSLERGRRGRAGPGWDRSRQWPRARRAGQGARGRTRLQAPHSRRPRPFRVRPCSAAQPDHIPGTLPHLSPRTTVGASGNVTSGARPAHSLVYPCHSQEHRTRGGELVGGVRTATCERTDQ